MEKHYLKLKLAAPNWLNWWWKNKTLDENDYNILESRINQTQSLLGLKVSTITTMTLILLKYHSTANWIRVHFSVLIKENISSNWKLRQICVIECVTLNQQEAGGCVGGKISVQETENGQEVMLVCMLFEGQLGMRIPGCWNIG